MAEQQPSSPTLAPALEPSDADYHFPRFEPYAIQRALMAHLYSSLSLAHVTVVESPTGTGKTLSLLSASLTWLNDAKSQARATLIESIRKGLEGSLGDEPGWVMEQEIKRQVDDLEREEKELEERLGEIRRREEQRRERGAKRVKLNHPAGKGREEKDLNDFAPDPYEEEDADRKKVAQDGMDNYTPEVRELMKKFSGEATNSTPVVEEPDVQKIYFASRTHSQLSQLIEELRKTPFASPPPQLSSPQSSTTPSTSSSRTHPLRVIPLGARQQLCINDEIRAKAGGSTEALNDLCLDTQKSGGKEKRCKFLPPLAELGKMNEFRDQALASVHTIGDIEDLGRKLHTCPYYGSRKAVRSAEFVTLPYNMLMQKSTREALGISLSGHVIIIDEAHNLIESLLSLHSVSISSSMLRSLRSALATYYNKFKTRFTGSNASYLKQLLLVLKALNEFANSWAGGETKGTSDDKGKGKEREKKKEEMMGVNQVMMALKGGALDQINLLKLDEYLNKSQIARKIGGYLDHLAEETTPKGRQALRSNATRHLQRIQAFLVSLVNPVNDGRILLTAERTPDLPGGSAAGKDPYEVTLKYMLLAPADSFKDIADEARSVVLAGGTMAPISDFREQLFPHLAPGRFTTFSCDHIVPPDHVATYALGQGPTGYELKFTFDKRKDEKLLDELGRTINNASQLVSKGVVVFFPSYDFLNQVQARWKTSGMLTSLEGKKKVFWEPTSSSDVEGTLEQYTAANSAGSKGGILFAVVGAKLSEGINFADDMARAVIICGIPYPNAQSTELKERMAYMKSLPRPPGSMATQDAGQVLYSNLAFRAVNQSIGRAIRHANDWAAIILLDVRYAQSSKQSQLPKWIGKNVQTPPDFRSFVKSLASFSRARRSAV